MLASLLEELFELSDVILIELDDDAPISARRSAELTLAPTAWLQCGVVRDFKAADRVDDEALAALADWITDEIYFASLDLAEIADALRLAAQRLIDEWEGGDVAGALQSLKSAVAFSDRPTRDADSDEIVHVLEARGYQLLDDLAEFTNAPTIPARLPAINEWVTVYPKNNWPAQSFTGRVTAVQGERVTVIDQDDDAWDVDLDQIELAESDNEDDDEADDDDDLCDNCFAAGVACDQTCPECGKTLCADCASENDGRCGGCAVKAEEDESDDDEDDAKRAVQK